MARLEGLKPFPHASRVLTIDEGDVVTRAEEIGRRVWRQLVARYPNVPFPIRLPPPVSGVAD